MTTRPNHPKNASKKIAEYITQMARNVVKEARTNGLWKIKSVTEDDYKEWAEMLASCKKRKELNRLQNKNRMKEKIIEKNRKKRSANSKS